MSIYPDSKLFIQIIKCRQKGMAPGDLRSPMPVSASGSCGKFLFTGYLLLLRDQYVLHLLTSIVIVKMSKFY